MADENKTRTFDWAAMVKEEQAKENPPFVPVAYEFSNGRKFADPGANGGVYTP